MDLNDFMHINKYKVILPILYVINITMMLTLPFFYPHIYRYYIFVIWTYGCYKGLQTLFLTIVGTVKGLLTMRRAEKFMTEKANATSGKVDVDDESHPINNMTDEVTPVQKKFLHAFIIPNYKEDLEIIGSTLQNLAKHAFAKQRYLVFLAMEAHQEGSAEKAKKLISQYGHNFKVMSYSHHVFKEPEAKGKASNVSWCVEHLEEDEFNKKGIDPDYVYLNIIDVDTWVPQFYMKEIDEHINANPETCLDHMYTPCQTFTRNWLEVPALARTFDQMHSTAQLSNIVTSINQGYCISNYSVSYNMMKRIGFWDTCADAIGEDMHTFIKASVKTNGKLKTFPIYTPFNQLNVQTDKGYFDGIMARFWQAERHARGCADFSYVLSHIFRQDRPAMSGRTITMIAGIIELFGLPAFLPWALVGYGMIHVAEYFGFHESTPSISDELLGTLINIGASCCSYSWLVYFFLARKASRVLYNIEVPYWRIIELPILIIVNMACICIPTFVIAAFKIWMGKNEYDVAEKSVKSKVVEASHRLQTFTPGHTATSV